METSWDDNENDNSNEETSPIAEETLALKIWFEQKGDQEIQDILNLLSGVGIESKDVCVSDDPRYHEQRSLITAHYGGKPVLTNKDAILGNLSKLRSYSQNELKNLVQTEPEKDNNNNNHITTPELGLTDTIMEYTKLASSYFNPYSYFPTYYNTIGEKEFDVVCVNSLRKYIRRICFYDSFFARLTKNRELKAMVEYANVSSAEFSQDYGGSLILCYNASPSHSSDIIIASQPILIEIVNIIHSKNANLIRKK